MVLSDESCKGFFYENLMPWQEYGDHVLAKPGHMEAVDSDESKCLTKGAAVIFVHALFFWRMQHNL